MNQKQRNDIWRSTQAQIAELLDFLPLTSSSVCEMPDYHYEHIEAHLWQRVPNAQLTHLRCAYCRSKFIPDARGNCTACGAPEDGDR